MPVTRLAFLGSGALGIPTLSALHSAGLVHVVMSQPDRPAGRGLQPAPTPISLWAMQQGVPLIRTQNANEGEALQAVRAAGGPLVVVAFGQRLEAPLIEGRESVNLHPSDLPRWRGAAPIQRAMLAGESRIGVCAIRLAQRMDAGNVLERFFIEVGQQETASEVLDRVAVEAVPMMQRVVMRWLHAAGQAPIDEQQQVDAQATRAAKLSKADASVCFSDSADRVRLRVHGLQPWPGCVVRVNTQLLRLLRVAQGSLPTSGKPGELLADCSIACGNGSVMPLQVQPQSGKVMPWLEWLRGQRLTAHEGVVLQSTFTPEQSS